MKPLCKHLALLSTIFLTSQSLAAAGTPHITIAPFFGQGHLSHDDITSHTTGYSVAISYQNAIGHNGLTLGPKLEFSNSFVSAKSTDNGDRIVQHYDNRILALGIHATYTLTGNPWVKSLFATTQVGRGSSGLTQDTTNSSLFRQDLYTHITGSYLAAETGVMLPIKPTFNIHASVLQSFYKLDQSDARGSYDSETLTPAGELSLTQGSHTAGDNGLSSSASQQLTALKLGITLSI